LVAGDYLGAAASLLKGKGSLGSRLFTAPNPHSHHLMYWCQIWQVNPSGGTAWLFGFGLTVLLMGWGQAPQNFWDPYCVTCCKFGTVFWGWASSCEVDHTKKCSKQNWN